MEIERKFLVKSELFQKEAVKVYTIRQGYLRSPDATVRIRTRDEEAFLTIKGKTDPTGIMREEWEYPIPMNDALSMLKLCTNGYIDKQRYLVPCGKHTWEVDVFSTPRKGLILAEIELNAPDETFERPEWLGQEVTGQKEYYNSAMLG